MSITLTQIIDQYIRACGPVGFPEILREVHTQCGAVPEHEVAAALTGLLGAGPIGLYDDGTSFTVAMTPAPAVPALLAAARGVVANWEHGDLAAAVRELAAAVATADAPAQAAHLLHHGGRCPACGSGDICGDSFEYNGDEHWQEVNCWTCGASWTDVFRLAAFTDLKPAEPEDFHCPDCGATAAQAGIVCNVCHRGMTERIG